MTTKEVYDAMCGLAETCAARINAISREERYDSKGMLTVLIKLLETGLEDE